MTNKLFSLTPSSTPAQIQSGRIYHLGEWCLRTRIGAFLFSFATSEVKRIDTTKRLYLPLVGALLFGAVGALIPTLPFVVATYRFGGYAEFMQVVVFIGFFPFFYLASLVVIIGVMYGAKQRYLGAILVNIVESKFFCRMCVAEMLLAALKRIYGKLGKDRKSVV